MTPSTIREATTQPYYITWDGSVEPLWPILAKQHPQLPSERCKNGGKRVACPFLPIHVSHPAGINCEARIQSSSITHSIRNQPRCPDILRNSRAFEVNTVTNILLGFPCDDNAYLITKIGYFRTQDATTTTSKDFPGPPAGLTRLPTCLTCRNSCCADRLRVQHE